MKETKPNTPTEFSVQSQEISDEELETVTGGTTMTTRVSPFQKQKDSSLEYTSVRQVVDRLNS